MGHDGYLKHCAMVEKHYSKKRNLCVQIAKKHLEGKIICDFLLLFCMRTFKKGGKSRFTSLKVSISNLFVISKLIYTRCKQSETAFQN